MKSLKLFATLSIVILSVAFVSGVVPADAQERTPPATNIVAFNGHNPGEVILTWDAAYGATHYRIGCVNMDRDYPRAKATVTGNWREAFVYVDVEAQNLSPERPSYTLHGLQEGAYHACSVLTNNARYGQPTWPFNPAWQYLTVTDHGGSCPAFELTVAPDTTEPLSIAQVGQLVRPALVQVSYPNLERGSTSGGSGFIVRSDGLVVTNRHVVDDRETMTVRLETAEGELLEFVGRVLGRGILTDLAAIQLSSNRTFSTVPLGDSDSLGVGDPVFSMGYPTLDYLGPDPTLNDGIVSAPERTWEDTRFVQHNADITGGNSGGPLLDRFGRVVGVNTYGLADSRGNVAGFYLAVASNEIRDRLATYEAGGPEFATYRNLRWDYGYSIDIPKGWYILDESNEGLTRQFSLFEAYGEERSSVLRTFRFSSPFPDQDAALGGLTGFFWNRYLDLVAEGNEWVHLEKISARPVEIAGQVFFRVEYRSREAEDECMRSHIALVSVSSSYPSKPFGFITDFAVCEDVLTEYAGERESILNTFRP